MKICPHCSSEDIEECATINPEISDYYCNGCYEYFNIYDIMP